MIPNPPKQRLLKSPATTTLSIWKLLQLISLTAGLTLFFALIFFPATGLLIFWNILIPVAPALLVLAVGVWRNICPMAMTSLLPRHLGWSKKIVMPTAWQSRLQLAAIVLLYLIVPLRHPVFNENGPATAMLLGGAALTGMAMGLVFDWKSGWCASLCPIHPVEKLYGSNTPLTLANAHCTECVNCSLPCPDSTPGMHPRLAKKNGFQEWSGVLTVGGLPGFIWGWFQVPDAQYTGKLNAVLLAYPLPLLGMTTSLCLYLMLKKYLATRKERLLVSVFAAAGVSCYYWFRIPALLGFGKFASDGILVSLQGMMPEWTIYMLRLTAVVFFFWWLVFRPRPNGSWLVRPAYKPGLRESRIRRD